MRPLEILIPLLLTLYTLWPLASSSARPQAVNVLPVLAAALAIVHIFVEGYRWQMIPLYVLTGIILAASLPGLFHTSTAGFVRLGWPAAGLLLTFILLAVSTALPALLPVPRVVAPSGPYAVGTTTLVLTDASRMELYSGKDEPRKFMAQVWYPASPGPGSQPAPWMADAEIVAPAIAEYIKLPRYFLNHLTLAKTTSYQDAPVDPEGAPYPVLVFSHGWSGFRAQTTFLMQELASHGYIVVGMEHPYGSVITVFPDGQVAHNNPSALPDGLPEAEYEAAARLLADQWAHDIDYALNVLGNMVMDVRGAFFGAFDFSRVGVLGHSTGGGAAIQFCGTQPGCKAVLGLDPFMTPVSAQVLEGGLSRPFMAMFSQRWADDAGSKNFRLFNGMLAQSSSPASVVSIQGTAHYDFSDLPALTPLAPQLKLKGPINGNRVQKIVNTYVLAFFDLHFKDIPTTLLDGPSPDYPEVKFIEP
jgi:predicted dienelactone hydrolase